jgi:Tfp pilus assembly protein PilO
VASINEIDLKNLLQSEQARKLAIGLGVGVLLLAAVTYLLVMPALGEKKKMENEIQQTQTQLESDRQLIAAQDKIHENHQQTACRLFEIMKIDLAPNQNAVAWAGTLFQDIAFEEGVKMTDITGESMNTPVQDKTKVPLFENFKAKSGLRTRYHNLGRFIAELEKRIPVAELVTLNVSQPPISENEIPQLYITLEYAFPRFTENGFPEEKRPTKEDCKPPTTNKEPSMTKPSDDMNNEA